MYLWLLLSGLSFISLAQFILLRRQFGQRRYMISDFTQGLWDALFHLHCFLSQPKVNGNNFILLIFFNYYFLCWHFCCITCNALHRPSWHLQQSQVKYKNKLGQEKKQGNIPSHPQRGTFGHCCAHDTHYSEFWSEQAAMKKWFLLKNIKKVCAF